MADQRQLIRDAQQRYSKGALALSVVLAAVLMLMGERLLGKGLILGALFSVLNFALMAVFIPLRLESTRRRGLVAMGSFLLRYSLLALPLLIAQLTHSVSVIGVAIGLFMVQIVIIGDQFWTRIRETD